MSSEISKVSGKPLGLISVGHVWIMEHPAEIL